MGFLSWNFLSADCCISGLSSELKAFIDFPMSISEARLTGQGCPGAWGSLVERVDMAPGAFGLSVWKTHLPSLSTIVFNSISLYNNRDTTLCVPTQFVTQLWNLSSLRAGLVPDS